MRILVEQSAYSLVNMGDLAMIQIAISRLRKLFPDASIEVFTGAPHRFVSFCPGASPLDFTGQHIWFSPLIKQLGQEIPGSYGKHVSEFEWNLRCSFPKLIKFLIDSKSKLLQKDTQSLSLFLESIQSADLVVSSGGGYITDAFKAKASATLGILGLANKFGVPTVMVGHGIGPLKDPGLRVKAKRVLPSTRLITLRESRAGLPLLDSLGVKREQIAVTGDDAIELAYQARGSQIGHGIGVNLRVTNYANVGTESIENVRVALQNVARAKNAPLIPVPIEFSDSSSDVKSIKQLLAGYDNESDGGQSLSSPLEVAKQAGQCRVVVTGSYHAGVFSLSQGIPIVALAKSEYYKDKFLGLADQFGITCELVFLDDPQLKEKLPVAIDRAWKSAEKVRPQLLEAAQKQITLGQIAYQKIPELVSNP